MNYIIGQKYQVEHGIGIYVGYEAFTPKGESLPNIPKDSSSDNNARKIFRLLPGHTWAFQDQLYATWNKDISKIA